MSKKKKTEKKVRNKSRDFFMDYYKTGLEYDEENRARQKDEEKKSGLRGLSSFEKTCIAIIILALIGFFIKIVVLGHSFGDFGI